MADSTPLLTQLTTAQEGKELTVNELLGALSPPSLFGRRQSSAGLNWDWFGGWIVLDGVRTAIANGTTALTASLTNYVECTRAGVVTKNTAGFTAGSIPLYAVLAGATTVTSYVDHRNYVKLGISRLVRSIATDANIVLTNAEERCDILEFTSGVSLTVTRNVQLPLAQKQWTVFNNTTGAQSLQFIGLTGTGVTVGSGKRAIIYSDGTNIVRVTADV